MSARTAAILNLDIPPTPKFVLVVIDSHTDGTGETMLSGDVLSAQTGLARETISRAVVFLEERKLLSVDRRPTEVNIYRVLLPAGTALALTSTPRSAPPVATPRRAAPTVLPSVVTPNEQQAALWQAFDRLCGMLPENASVQWQRIRLKSCQLCVERGISAEELEAAARALGLQPGYGAGEQALIAEVMDIRGTPERSAYGRPMFKKPDTVSKVNEGLRMFREARSAGN